MTLLPSRSTLQRKHKSQKNYLSSSVAVVAGDAGGRSGPGLSSLHHHSASAGERRGGPGPRQLSLQGRRVTTTLTQPGVIGSDKRYQGSLLLIQTFSLFTEPNQTYSFQQDLELERGRKGSL